MKKNSKSGLTKRHSAFKNTNKITSEIRGLAKVLYYKGRGVFWSNNYVARLFALEGILTSAVLVLAHNNNNLYATRLGATALDLGLMASLPPLIGLIIIFPFAIILDRLKNKRIAVLTAVSLWSFVYFLVGFVAFLPAYNVPVLIFLLVTVNIPISLFNTSWQAFFSDVVDTKDRNSIYSHRTRMNIFTNIVLPLIVGSILSLASGRGKIMIHQIYYWLTIPLALAQVYFIRKIPGGQVEDQSKLQIKNVVVVCKNLLKSKKFLGFLALAFIIYCGWQMDWSIYFLAQFRYLELNEAQISLIGVLGATTQFLSLGIWSKIVARKGAKLVLAIGIFGLACSALIMFFSLQMTGNSRIIIYFVCQSISASTFGAFQIAIFQCLLEVIPSTYRALSIAVYSWFLMVSNVIMPYLGSYIYTQMGETRKAMVYTFLIMAIFRFIATCFAILRWLMLDIRPNFPLKSNKKSLRQGKVGKK